MTPDNAAFLRAYLLPQYKNEVKTTTAVIGAVPDEKADYKPQEQYKTARELSAHILTVELFALQAIVDGQFSKPSSLFEGKSIGEMLALYNEKVPGLIEAVSQVPPDKLVIPMQFRIFNWPAVAYLSLILAHTTHHRGQLSAYLRPMGSKVPIIYGESADFKPTAAAQSQS